MKHKSNTVRKADRSEEGATLSIRQEAKGGPGGSRRREKDKLKLASLRLPFVTLQEGKQHGRDLENQKTKETQFHAWWEGNSPTGNKQKQAISAEPYHEGAPHHPTTYLGNDPMSVPAVGEKLSHQGTFIHGVITKLWSLHFASLFAFFALGLTPYPWTATSGVFLSAVALRRFKGCTQKATHGCGSKPIFWNLF